MTKGQKSGFTRLAIGLGLPWVAFWSWLYIDASRILDRVQESYSYNLQHYERARRHNPHIDDDIRIDWQIIVEQRPRKRLAVSVGLGVPVALAVIFGLAVWVRRGFVRV